VDRNSRYSILLRATKGTVQTNGYAQRST